MADNTAKARKDLEGMRKAVEEHIGKYQSYPDRQDKETALKTIQRVQGDIAATKAKHPSLTNDSSRLDSWRP
jgi:hypothetical protein